MNHKEQYSQQLTLFFIQVYRGRTFFDRSRDFGVRHVLPIDPVFVQELVGTDMISNDTIVKYHYGVGNEREDAKYIIIQALNRYLRVNMITPDKIGTIVSQYFNWSDQKKKTEQKYNCICKQPV